jgi:hypothetical protein
MANSRNANSSVSVNYLIGDAVGTNPEGTKSPEPATKQMTGIRFTLQQAERLRHRVDQRPIETQQVAPGSPSEHNSGHG